MGAGAGPGKGALERPFQPPGPHGGREMLLLSGHRHQAGPTRVSPSTAGPGQDVHTDPAGPGRSGSSGRSWHWHSRPREACVDGCCARGPLMVGRASWSLLSSPGDDSSGSGSGDSCPDDLCGRRVSKKSSSPRTTLTHALPGLSEREGQKTSASGCPRPCVSLMLLLSLVLSAARPTWR